MGRITRVCEWVLCAQRSGLLLVLEEVPTTFTPSSPHNKRVAAAGGYGGGELYGVVYQLSSTYKTCMGSLPRGTSVDQELGNSYSLGSLQGTSPVVRSGKPSRCVLLL